MYKGTLEVAPALNDDDRSDMVECGAAVQLQLKLELAKETSDQSIATTDAIGTCRTKVLLFYQHKV